MLMGFISLFKSLKFHQFVVLHHAQSSYFQPILFTIRVHFRQIGEFSCEQQIIEHQFVNRLLYKLNSHQFSKSIANLGTRNLVEF